MYVNPVQSPLVLDISSEALHLCNGVCSQQRQSCGDVAL